MKVTGYPDLTIETLEALFGEARIMIKSTINDFGKATVGLFFSNNRWSFGRTKECQKPIAEVTITVIADPCIYAEMLTAKVWEREFPVSAKLKEIQPLSQKCGELMEWLETKEIHFGKYHKHTEECSNPVVWGLPEGTRNRNHFCGLSEGVLYPETISMTRLLAEFFDIDIAALEAEKQRMLDEVRNPNKT